jgi:hypothetical protein
MSFLLYTMDRLDSAGWSMAAIGDNGGRWYNSSLCLTIEKAAGESALDSQQLRAYGHDASSMW